jgi:hypothetical protein
MTILIKTPQAGFTCQQGSAQEFFAENNGFDLFFYSAERSMNSYLYLNFEYASVDYWGRKQLIID